MYGSHFRRVTLTDDSARRPARQGEYSDGHLLCHTGRRRCARQVDPGEHLLGTPPPPPPPNVPALKENAERSKPLSMRERWKSTAPTPPVRAATRSWIRWASRWRISTRWARGAPGRQVCRLMRVGSARGRDQGRRPGDPAAGAARTSRTVRADDDGEASDVRARPGADCITTCRWCGAIVRDAAGRGLPILVARARHRPQRAVSDADGSAPRTEERLEARVFRRPRVVSLKPPASGLQRRQRHVYHQNVVVSPDGPQGHGRHACAAVARCDGARCDRPGKDCREPVAQARRRVRADGGATRLLDAVRRRDPDSSSRRS